MSTAQAIKPATLSAAEKQIIELLKFAEKALTEAQRISLDEKLDTMAAVMPLSLALLETFNAGRSIRGEV